MRLTPHRVLLLILAAGTALFLAACAAKSSYVTVTFSVDGTEYPQSVSRGEIPIFTGSAEKPADSEHYYKFIGWDRELAPAEEDTVYTACYEVYGAAIHKITWVLYDDIVTTEAHDGETPAPPDGFDAEVTTDALSAVFTGWDHEPEAAHEDSVYRAKYDRTPRTYPVVFCVDGKEVASYELKYNTTPTPPDGVIPEKEGYHFAFWANADQPVKGATVCNAVFTKFPREQLDWALATELTGYPTKAGTNDNGADIFSKTSALLYLALEEHDNPQESEIRERILAHLRNLIAGGNEPYFDLQPYWNYCTLSAAIAVCRDTPTVWDALTEDEKARLDCIMSSFAYVLTLGTADGNDYSTGPGLVGNYGKNWNPNYRLANVTPMIFVTSYFGSTETVNAMLKSFDYDAQMALFEKYGFTRAYARWSTPAPTLPNGKLAPTPKEIMENGGPAYYGDTLDGSAGRLGISGGKPAGRGVGVRVEYKYKGCTLNDLCGIFNLLLDNCYSGGKVIDSYGKYKDGSPKAYILNGGSSPVLGLDGMMLEFKSGDGGDGVHGSDIRSSCAYTSHDFIMVTAALAALEALDIYDPAAPGNAAMFKKVWVGNTDTVYKIETGYMSYSLGKGYESHESDSNGYLLWKSWWNEHYGALRYEDLPS